MQRVLQSPVNSIGQANFKNLFRKNAIFRFLWGKGWECGEKRKKSLTNNGKKVRLLQAFFVCLAQTARGWVRMLIAYNNDIEFRSRWYHIQTEDNGIKDGHVTTTVFFSGQILDSKTTSYLDAINGITDVEEQNRIIKNVMTTQHKLFYAKLYEGAYEAQVNHVHKAGMANSAATSSPSVVPVSKPVAKMATPAPSARADQAASSSRLGKPDILRASQQLPTANKNLGSLPPLSSSSKVGLSSKLASNAETPRESGRQMRLSRPLGQSKGVMARNDGRRAWRGVEWPKEDLSVDALVALLLAGVEV